MIRPATALDAPAIAPIWNQVIRETTITFNPTEKTLSEVETLIAQNCLVWEEAGTVQGFGRIFPFRGGEGYRFTVEHTIMIHPGSHGRGGGRALLDALCQMAKAQGMHTMIAACSAEKPEAVKFHAACGFVTVATMPEVGFKFGRWIDLVLMQKSL